jgi:hypothetical protein
MICKCLQTFIHLFAFHSHYLSFLLPSLPPSINLSTPLPLVPLMGNPVQTPTSWCKTKAPSLQAMPSQMQKNPCKTVRVYTIRNPSKKDGWMETQDATASDLRCAVCEYDTVWYNDTVPSSSLPSSNYHSLVAHKTFSRVLHARAV